MYPSSFEYHRPTTLDEAAGLLAANPEAKLLAGGHSLLPAMRLRLATPSALVDLSGVRGLTGVTESAGALRVGALTTHADVASSAVVRRVCPLLAETAAEIGDLQVRNRGTIGGSLAHADPAADYPTALLALDATVETGGKRARGIPVADFFTGLFSTVLEPGEIVTAVHVPAPASGSGGAYEKHRHPASSFAVVGVAALVTLEIGRISLARVAIGGVSPNPVRATAAETALAGRAPDASSFAAAAAEVAAALARPISDLYASGAFRVHLATSLARRALVRAAATARGA